MSVEQAFDVLHISGAMSDCLHDQKVFNSGESDGDPADHMVLAVGDSILLERQTAQNDIDIDLRFLMPEQKNAGANGESDWIVDPRHDAVL